ncbi:MAG: ribonuclease III [Acutalibacter sp.]|nr:ribonuclease III [Acutalibacter sp.]
MATLLGQPGDYRLLSPLDLAFVGDGVFDLLCRELLLRGGSCPVKKLHQRKTELVNCQAQARALEKLWPGLSEEERAVALRGRNAHVGHVPKNASTADYHGATALEALFGWLYLGGETQRLRELFQLIMDTAGAAEGV